MNTLKKKNLAIILGSVFASVLVLLAIILPICLIKNGEKTFALNSPEFCLDGKKETDEKKFEKEIDARILENENIFKNDIFVSNSSKEEMFIRVQLDFIGENSSSFKAQFSPILDLTNAYTWEEIGNYYYLVDLQKNPLAIKSGKKYRFLNANSINMVENVGINSVKISAKSINKSKSQIEEVTSKKVGLKMGDKIEEYHKLTIDFTNAEGVQTISSIWINSSFEISVPKIDGHEVYINSFLYEGGEIYTVEKPEGNKEVKIAYKKNTYKVKTKIFNNGDGIEHGTINPASVNVLFGGNATFEITPNQNYMIEYLKVNNKEVEEAKYKTVKYEYQILSAKDSDANENKEINIEVKFAEIEKVILTYNQTEKNEGENLKISNTLIQYNHNQTKFKIVANTMALPETKGEKEFYFFSNQPKISDASFTSPLWSDNSKRYYVSNASYSLGSEYWYDMPKDNENLVLYATYLKPTSKGDKYDKQNAVILSHSVEEIPDYKYENSTDIQFLIAGDNIKKIGNSAFKNCVNLLRVILPDGLTTIEESAFEGATYLDEVVLPQKLLELKASVFENCYYLNKITLPNGLTRIGDNAFKNCSSLNNIVLPETLREVGRNAFYKCSSLESLTLPTSVQTLSAYAFYGCSSLKTIQLPAMLRKIEYALFSECYSLTSIIIPDGVTEIADFAFINCYSLKEIRIPENVSSLQNSTFSTCSSLEKIEVAPENQNYTSDGGVLYNKNKTTLIQYPIANTQKSFTIPEGVLNINYAAFYGAKNLGSVIISESVKNIGEFAFTGCEKLEEIYLPKNVENIGDNAFSNCYSIVNFKVAKDNSYFSSLDGVLYNKDKSILIKYPTANKRENFEVLSSVRTVSFYAFQNSSNLKIVKFLEGAEKIDFGAFMSCENLMTVVLPQTLKRIEASAFEKCYYLTNVKMPKTMEYLGDHAFYDCSYLFRIEIPEGLVVIEASTFENCHSLTEIKLPTTLLGLEANAFYKCYALSNVNFPENLQYVGMYAFYNCYELNSIIELKNAMFIDDYAFYGCLKLNKIILGEKMTYLGEGAFYECENLTEIQLLSKEPFNLGNYVIKSNSKTTFTVASDCLEKYRTNENWAEYKDKIFAF